MREGTSGLLFTQYDSGDIRVEVVDYGVEEFDGRDWESWYDLNKENAEKLFKELSKLHSGTFKEIMVQEFGKDFEILKFVRFCEEHGIKYSHMTWCS